MMNQIFTWEMDGNGCFTISIHFEQLVWACRAHVFLAPPPLQNPPCMAPNPPERPRGSPPPPFGPPGWWEVKKNITKMWLGRTRKQRRHPGKFMATRMSMELGNDP